MAAQRVATRISGAAFALLLAGCGLTPPSGSETAPDTPVQPHSPQTTNTAPTSAATLATIQRDVAAAYQATNTLAADYENHQTRGGETYFAKVHMRFSKPRKLRLDIQSSSDALLSGASVLWLGGATLTGKKSIGIVPIVQTHTLAEKPCLRGWQENQTDYDAMVQSLLQGLPSARILGTTSVAGTAALMVEFRASLPGVQVERIGIDPVHRLPIYRELRESAQGSPVFTTVYTHLQPNATLSRDAFTL